MSSAVSHEMITPIKCIICMTEEHKKTVTNEADLNVVDLIEITAKMLLNQVKGSLESIMLDKNMF